MYWSKRSKLQRNTISVIPFKFLKKKKKVKLWGYIIRRENYKGKKQSISIKGITVITSRGQEGSCARERTYWGLLRSDNVPFLELQR